MPHPPHEGGDVGGSDEGGALRLHQPHVEELVIEPARVAGAWVLDRLEPTDGPSLREHPGQRRLALLKCI